MCACVCVAMIAISAMMVALVVIVGNGGCPEVWWRTLTMGMVVALTFYPLHQVALPRLVLMQGQQLFTVLGIGITPDLYLQKQS